MSTNARIVLGVALLAIGATSILLAAYSVVWQAIILTGVAISSVIGGLEILPVNDGEEI